MLITIRNLPSNTRYVDLKSLLQSTCAVKDVILDNLLPDGNNAKKVTVGVPGEAEASTIVKNLNGYCIQNMKLIVELVGQKKTEAKPYYMSNLEKDPKQNQSKSVEQPESFAQMFANQALMQMMSSASMPNPMGSYNMNASGTNFPYNATQAPYVGYDPQQQYGNVNMMPQLVSYPMLQNYGYGFGMGNFQNNSKDINQAWNSNNNIAGNSGNTGNNDSRNSKGQSGFDSYSNSRQSNLDRGQTRPALSGPQDSQNPRMSQTGDHARDRKRKRSESPARGQPFSRQSGLEWSNNEQKASRSFNQMGQNDSRPNNPMGQSTSRPFHQMEQNASRSNNTIGQSSYRPFNQMGQNISRPINPIGQGASRPFSQMAQNTFHTNNQMGQHASRPFNQMGQSASRPFNQMGQSTSRPFNQMGQSTSRPFNQMGSNSRDDYQRSEMSYNRNLKSAKTSESDRPSAHYGINFAKPHSRGGFDPSATAKRNRFGGDTQSQKWGTGYRGPSTSNDGFSRGPKSGPGGSYEGSKKRDDTDNRKQRNKKSPIRYFNSAPVEIKTTFQSASDKNQQQNKNDLLLPTSKVLIADETARGQAANKIAKNIMGHVNVNRTVNKHKVLRKLTQAVRSRLILIMSTTCDFIYADCWKAYRQVFNENDDQHLYNVVVMRVKREIRDKVRGDDDDELKPGMQPKRAANKSNPAANEPNTAVNEPTPAVNDPNPAVNEPIPAVADNVANTEGAAKKNANNKNNMGVIPKYPQGDKQLYREHRKESQIQATEGPRAIQGDPQVKSAVAKEIEDIEKVLLQQVEEESKGALDKEKTFFQRFKRENVSAKVNRVLQMNLLRRLLKTSVNPIIRIKGNPKLPRKSFLTDFLKGRGVIGLKKSVKHPMYVATCWSYDSFDKLCSLGKTTIDGVDVTFRPMNLTGPPEKGAMRNPGLKEPWAETVDDFIIDDLHSDNDSNDEFDNEVPINPEPDTTDPKQTVNSSEPKTEQLKSGDFLPKTKETDKGEENHGTGVIKPENESNLDDKKQSDGSIANNEDQDKTKVDMSAGMCVKIVEKVDETVQLENEVAKTIKTKDDDDVKTVQLKIECVKTIKSQVEGDKTSQSQDEGDKTSQSQDEGDKTSKLQDEGAEPVQPKDEGVEKVLSQDDGAEPIQSNDESVKTIQSKVRGGKTVHSEDKGDNNEESTGYDDIEDVDDVDDDDLEDY